MREVKNAVKAKKERAREKRKGKLIRETTESGEEESKRSSSKSFDEDDSQFSDSSSGYK